MFVTEAVVPKTNYSRVFEETNVKYSSETVNIKSANVDGYNLIKARDVLNLLGISVD